MKIFLLSRILLLYMVLFSSPCLSCPVTIPTVAYVSRCPSNESEWESAALQKQCNKLATLQSCSDPGKFVYHCVLSKDGTQYIEVCAQSWFMSGYCARFSVADGRIINDPGLDCTKFSPPCPSRFQSNESFKYQECYSNLEQPTSSKKTKEAVKAETQSNSGVLIGILCIFVISTVVLAIFIALLLSKKTLLDCLNRRRRKNGNENQRSSEELTPLNKTNEDQKADEEHSNKTEIKEEETEEQNEEGETKEPGSISAAHDKKEEDHSDNKIVDSPTEDKESAAKGSDGADCNKKMDFRTLSVFRGSCSLKNVAVISDLRANLSTELHKRKEDVWIVQKETGIIYNDDTTFPEFIKHQKHIEVMIGKERRSVFVEYRSTDPELDVITNKFGPSQKCRMTCNHFTEPENLFNYTKDKIKEGNADVKCPKCQASWELEEIIVKSDMSEDEQVFYKKAMSINKQTMKRFNTFSS